MPGLIDAQGRRRSGRVTPGVHFAPMPLRLRQRVRTSCASKDAASLRPAAPLLQAGQSCLSRAPLSTPRPYAAARHSPVPLALPDPAYGQAHNRGTRGSI